MLYRHSMLPCLPKKPASAPTIAISLACGEGGDLVSMAKIGGQFGKCEQASMQRLFNCLKKLRTLREEATQ